MYHGYTLIDAQVKKWCPALMESLATRGGPLRCTAPLFRDDVPTSNEAAQHHDVASDEGSKPRDPVGRELEIGRQNIFLLRCRLKYPRRVTALAIALLALYPVAFVLAWRYRALLLGLPGVARQQCAWAAGRLMDLEISPESLLARWLFDPPIKAALALGGVYAALLPVWILYEVVRQLTRHADVRRYRRLTRTRTFTAEWPTSKAEQQ